MIVFSLKLESIFTSVWTQPFNNERMRMTALPTRDYEIKIGVLRPFLLALGLKTKLKSNTLSLMAKLIKNMVYFLPTKSFID